jgi:fluoride ion exporter CrcB/FEX
MNDPVTLALVFVGGAGGSAIRWLVGVGVGERYKGTFPLGTFLINVSGAFLMGFLSTLFNSIRQICTTRGRAGWHFTGLARWLQV